MIYTEEKASQKFLLLTKDKKLWITPNNVLIKQKVFKKLSDLFSFNEFDIISENRMIL